MSKSHSLKKLGSTKNTMKRLLQYIGKDKVAFFFVFLCVIFSASTMLLGAYLLRPVVNTLAEDVNIVIPLVRDSKEYRTAVAEGGLHLLKGILVMGSVYFLGVVTSYFQARIMIGISQRAIQGIRNDLFKKIQSLPIRFFDERST